MDRKIVAGAVAASFVAIPVIGVAAASASSTPTPTTTTATRTAVVSVKPPFKFGTKKYSKWYAKSYMKKKYGWGPNQYRAVVKIFDHESGWSHRSMNHGSGAYGIPQALPGGKMKSAGKDWRTNPETQIRWGLKYIHDRYGNPTKAWSFWQGHSWY